MWGVLLTLFLWPQPALDHVRVAEHERLRIEMEDRVFESGLRQLREALEQIKEEERVFEEQQRRRGISPKPMIKPKL